MDNKQIKDLMAAMGRWNIKKVGWKTPEGEEILLEREDYREVVVERSPERPMRKEPMSHPPQSLTHPHHRMDSAHEGAHPPAKGELIESPMVGTFYSSPSPDEPPFVKVGDRIDSETVVCIIEAMKVMNEVKAGVTGVIKEIYLENGQPVEYGTKLFRVE